MSVEYVKIAAQIVIAISIYNVWFFGLTTHKIQGGDAQSKRMNLLLMDFQIIHLGNCFPKALATLLLIGIYFNSLVFPASVGMALLMVGAITMHVKVKDDIIKSLPATIFLILSLSVAFLVILKKMSVFLNRSKQYFLFPYL